MNLPVIDLPRLSDHEQDDLRTRILGLQSQLAAAFVAKDHIAHLIVLSAIAGEPLLLVGAPGSGKSAMVKHFVHLLELPRELFLKYVVTPSTQPSELSHNVTVGAEQGSGPSLMTAQVMFLDEVFHANSAVLNLVLRRLSHTETEWSASGSQRGGFQLVVAATKSLDHPVPNASLLDRFILQATCDTENRDRFSDVIRAGIRGEVGGFPAVAGSNAVEKDFNAVTEVVGVIAQDSRAVAEVFSAVADLSTGTDARVVRDSAGAGRHDDAVCCRDDFARANQCVRARLAESALGANGAMDFTQQPGSADFERLIRRLGREDRVFVSDRKLIKLFKLLATEAWLLGEPLLARGTFQLLSYIGNTADEMQILADKVPLLIEQL